MTFLKERRYLLRIGLFLAASLIFACTTTFTGSGSREGPKTDPVPADGVLEAVTWNLEWYGSDSNGPDDETLQTNNTIEVMDSLDADLYALQEIHSQQALNTLTNRLQGYRGFVASHVDWVQKTAFIYNTHAIDSVDSGAITSLQSEHDWAGRLPMYFSFNYIYQDLSIPVFAVVIHAKASTDMESYERRGRAADSLYSYLIQEKPDANIVLLGDFNDDVDVSISGDTLPSPYQNFVSDSARFSVVTRPLSENGKTSFLGFETTDLIDHIIISDELFEEYIPSSESIYNAPLEYIENYSSTTSDHLPVWTKIEINSD